MILYEKEIVVNGVKYKAEVTEDKDVPLFKERSGQDIRLQINFKNCETGKKHTRKKIFKYLVMAEELISPDLLERMPPGRVPFARLRPSVEETVRVFFRESVKKMGMKK